MKLHEAQRKVVASRARFKVIRAGRKGGKTSMEVENIVYKAVAKAEDLPISKKVFATGRKVLYLAPTSIQARNIIWEALKNRLHNIGTPNEQMLQMKVPNADGTKSTIYVGGWENRENYRGLTDVIHITFDEVDTLRNFFIAWLDIFRPMFLDTSGTANFIGTPQKENPNLRRLEKEFEGQSNAECFHFTSRDNPFLPIEELNALEKEYEGNRDSYKQEVLAEHIDDSGALFKYTALLDLFSNTITKNKEKYLIVDIADDGSDKTIFSFWNDLELYRIEQFEQLNTESIINQIREYASEKQIPYSHIAVDAIGVGAGVASSSMLSGIIGYKSSFQAFKIDRDAVKLPNVNYTKDAPRFAEYRNLRSQCVFTLADLSNNHKIAVKIEDVRIKEKIIEELAHYQDASVGDGKKMATAKDDIKAQIGRSPDITDTMLMRMYFVLREKLQPQTSEEVQVIANKIKNQFDSAFKSQPLNSTR